MAAFSPWSMSSASASYTEVPTGVFYSDRSSQNTYFTQKLRSLPQEAPKTVEGSEKLDYYH